MRVLLTGANGQVGSALVGHLPERHHLVAAVFDLDRAGAPYGVYYGVSANTRLTWGLSRAAAEIGYQPKDDAEIFVQELRAAGEKV